MLFFEREEASSVFKGRGGVVDRAGPDYDEEAIEGVMSVEDGGGFLAAGNDGALGLGGLRDFMLEEIRWRERVVSSNSPILGVRTVPNALIL